MKLALGSAQFGLNYGISNRLGQVNQQTLRAILQLAKQRGIQFIDSAPAYGNAQQQLGMLIDDPQDFAIISKTLSLQDYSLKSVIAGIEQSLLDLKRKRIEGLLVHHADDLLSSSGQALYLYLTQLQQQKIINKIGISAYSPQQARRIVRHFDIDMIQLPLNLLDQRFLQNDLLVQLKQKNIDIHVRSIFLQGLLLMPSQSIPDHLSDNMAAIQHYHRFLKQHQLSALQAALGFIHPISEIDYVICGVQSAAQLQQIMQHYQSLSSIDFSSLASDNLSLIDPRRWLCTA